MTEKLRFHRKKHDENGNVVVSPSTGSGSTDHTVAHTAEPGQIGRLENGVVVRQEEEEEQPQMNIVTTIVRGAFGCSLLS